MATTCVIEGDLDGVDLATAFAVVHDADGHAHGVTEQELRERVKLDRRISTMYESGLWEAEFYAERADRLERDLDAGYVTPETLEDVFDLELRCDHDHPLDDPVLGSKTVSVQSLRPERPRLAAAPPPARSFRLPRRRLVRVAPRRRERRATTRRATRAGPARPRSADDDSEHELVAREAA